MSGIQLLDFVPYVALGSIKPVNTRTTELKKVDLNQFHVSDEEHVWSSWSEREDSAGQGGFDSVPHPTATVQLVPGRVTCRCSPL